MGYWPNIERNQQQIINADTQILKAELLKLKSGLDEFDSDAMNEAAKNLQAFTKDADFGEAVADILQRKLIGEYDEAIELINNFIEKM